MWVITGVAIVLIATSVSLLGFVIAWWLIFSATDALERVDRRSTPFGDGRLGVVIPFDREGYADDGRPGVVIPFDRERRRSGSPRE